MLTKKPGQLVQYPIDENEDETKKNLLKKNNELINKIVELEEKKHVEKTPIKGKLIKAELDKYYNMEHENFNLNVVSEALEISTHGKKFKTGITAGFFGSTKSGKSYLLADTINKLNKMWDIIIIFSINIANPLFDILRNYSHIIFIDKFKPQLVETLHIINSSVDIDKRYSILCVLDDLIDDKENPILKNMLITYRNANISTFISSQAYSIVSKKARANLNFVFLGKFNNTEAKADIIDIYLSGNNKYMGDVGYRVKVKKDEELRKYEKMTKEHNFIVVDNLHDENIYKYRA
jgi:hypothetical protein